MWAGRVSQACSLCSGSTPPALQKGTGPQLGRGGPRSVRQGSDFCDGSVAKQERLRSLFGEGKSRVRERHLCGYRNRIHLCVPRPSWKSSCSRWASFLSSSTHVCPFFEELMCVLCTNSRGTHFSYLQPHIPLFCAFPLSTGD